PALTEAGRRHPVTAGLDGAGQGAPSGAAADLPPWGRWLQYSEMRAAPDADVVMEAEGDPLLILRRQGEGRVALLASDQVWLWGRGFEGGGPQSELLRRIAHWSMKEPELEEEALTVTPAPPGPDGAQRVTITRRSVETSVPPVTILGPNSGSGAGAALGADGPVDGSATSPRGSAPGEPSGAAETPSGTAAPPDNQAGSTAGTVPGEPSGGTETQSGTTAPSDGQAESTAGAVPGAAAASDGAESTPGVPSSGSDAIPGATEQPDSRPDNTSDAPTQPADGAESTPGAGPNEPTGRAEALPGASAPPANSDEAAADAASGANAPSDGRPENTSDAAQHANAAQSTPGAGPAGATEAARIDLTETAPGRFSAEWTAPGPGLYVASQGDLRRSFALGPPSPREFRRVIAEEADFAPATAATGGAILRLSDGIPTLRTVAPGRPAHGSALSGNWLGITERGAQTIAGLSRHPVLPPWAWLALIGTLLTLGWLADGRRRG
ncbi:MAG: hypothetical protein Q4F71_13220, partial [Paracoccus sp. (in: a-proteobacteria)]|nr:hypothetical protein [Paracoccus sp. (in: a-proteobacteria)]